MSISEMHKINIAVIIFLIIAYIFGFDYPQFKHANLFHLICNCWCIYTAVNDRIINRYLIYTVIITCGAFTFMLYNGNAVGFSGALFAMIGISYSHHLTRRNTIMLAAIFLVNAIIPNLALFIHFVSFALGFTIGMIIKRIRKYRYEHR